MDNMVKMGVIGLGALAVVGAIVTVFKSSSPSPPSYPETSPAPAQEYTPPAEEPYDLPGGMERESEDSADVPERGSVGGSCKSRRKRKSKRKKRSKSVCRKMK